VLSDGDGNPRFGYADWDGNGYLHHRFNMDVGGQHAVRIIHSTTGTPYGISMQFTGASPDNNASYFLSFSDSTASRFRVDSDGDVKNHDNSYGAISDQKLKQQIADTSSQWDDIKAIQVRKYKMNDDVSQYGDSDGLWRIGVIAQELEASGMNGLVKENPDFDEDNNDLGTTTKSVKYSILYMKAVKALQEAMDRIETLEAKVTALENA
jgi:hypothetical protein